MKYLFFDTEKSNSVHTDKLCEFGYIITDEKLNIISNEDIPMSPGRGKANEFESLRENRDPNFHWAYEQDFYFTCPEFDTYYKRIKNLLEDKDTIVFAFSAIHDVKAINHACRRYRKPYIDFKTYDIQVLFARATLSKDQEWTQISQENAYARYKKEGEINNFTSHFPQDDATMAMLTLKGISKELSLDVSSLITDYCPECVCECFTPNHMDCGFYPYKPVKVKFHISKECDKLWKDFLYSKNDVTSQKDFNEKLYALYSSVRESRTKVQKVIDITKDSNEYYPVLKIDLSNILVCKDEDDIEFVKNRLKRPYNGTFMAYDDFIKLFDK